jgi:hypothetical protein
MRHHGVCASIMDHIRQTLPTSISDPLQMNMTSQYVDDSFLVIGERICAVFCPRATIQLAIW